VGNEMNVCITFGILLINIYELLEIVTLKMPGMVKMPEMMGKKGRTLPTTKVHEV
jgi:hypothetical protein